MTSICEHCGHELRVGDWPHCPHGRGSFINVPDDVPGGFVVENGFDEPTRFYSHSEHRAALAARGMELRPKWAGEHDKHLTRWDSVDLDGARAMLERQAAEKAARVQAAQAEFPITVTRVTVPEETHGTQG